ncbi:hypothetical protein [Planotetraspora phitsanulokensis]|uniref:hypothetical protein n=1 Tax=Planotetraspora phitsanulokensis TaxID=575192 RepID=UPI0019525512|nr:hypothetical protein [Planotetraspora phitsanulokensis]
MLPLGEKNVEVKIRTEDPTLANCMGARILSHAPVAVRPVVTTVSVVLLSASPTKYDLGIEEGVRRALNTRTQEVIAFKCTTMIEADLALRSAIAISLPGRLEGMHGALLRLKYKNSVDVRSRTWTVALLGASGAGKSHIIAQFLADPECEVAILAEDWFVACADTGRAYSLPERHILLKHETASMYSGAEPAPEPSYPDLADGTRALYDANRLFATGSKGGGGSVIDTLVVLRAESSAAPHIRRLTAEDAQWIRAGAYSAYYQAKEQLLDGSSEVFTAAQIDRRLANLLRLAERTSAFVFAGSHAINGHAALRTLLFLRSGPDPHGLCRTPAQISQDADGSHGMEH